DYPDERTVSLLAISVSHLEEHWRLQLELPLGLEDEKRRPGTKRGIARWTADRAVDMIRDRFGWDAVDTDQSCWALRGPFPMSFPTSLKGTFSPLALTFADLCRSFPTFLSPTWTYSGSSDRRRRDGYRHSGLLRLGHRVQPVCRGGVLIVIFNLKCASAEH